jgi:hypothetical protein
MKRAMMCIMVLASTTTAYAYDYPTLDRVEYVEKCMVDSGGSRHEMLYKCSCAIDAVAKEMPYEEYVDASTAANAMSIGGERGGVIRDSQVGKDLAAKFRAVQGKAKKSCFLN